MALALIYAEKVSIAASFVVGAATTWMASNLTNPLVGGGVGAITALVCLIAEKSLESAGLEEEKSLISFIAIEVVGSYLCFLMATSLGYALSFPLTLLLTLASCVTCVISRATVLYTPN